MAIETHIPKEITHYKERLLGEFSVRQIGAIGGCVAVTGISYLLLVRGLHMSMDIYPYIAMLLVAPVFLAGFYKRDNMPFEQFVGLLVRQYFGRNKLSWAAEFDDADIERAYTSEITEKEEAKKHVRKKDKRCASGAPQEIEIPTKEGFKAATKAIQGQIKSAKNECRAVKRAYQKAHKK